MKKKQKILEHYIAFDIETTSTKINDEKVAFTWHWQVMREDQDGNNYYYEPSSWDDFKIFLLDLKTQYNEYDKCIIWVQYLGFEFEALIRNLDLKCEKVFSVKSHTPIYAIFDSFFEFRCFWKLTNKSLAENGKDVNVPKGEDFDYSVYREPGYVKTEQEQSYVYNDVKIIIEKLKLLEQQENMPFWEFPLTNTGFVRGDYKQSSVEHNGRKDFEALIMTPAEFIACKKAFRGGDTHANYMYIGQIMEDVDYWDRKSSYPASLAIEKFPMRKWQHTVIATKREFYNALFRENIVSIFEVTFINLRPRSPHHYISFSGCRTTKDVVLDNGRVVSASMCQMTTTSVDMKIILQNYSWDNISINDYMYAKTDYIPQWFVDVLIKYYINKEEIGDIIKTIDDYDLKLNYMKSKNRVNASYGMLVQNPIQEETTINLENYEWFHTNYNSSEDKINEIITKYYKSKTKFLPYQWGVFTTAYAREALHYPMQKIGNDILYYDTDANIFINDHTKVFNEYNNMIRKKVLLSKERNNLPNRIIGIGEFEQDKHARLNRFCTLGAKKYLYEDNKGNHTITVSGLSKNAVNYMGDDPFKYFHPNVTFSGEVSGRTTAACVTNNPIHIDHGCTHVEQSTYTLGIAKTFRQYLDIDDQLNYDKYTIYKDRIEKGGKEFQKTYDIDELIRKGML